jgi:uncharacterized membrane protein YhaH (DUF805 family)
MSFHIGDHLVEMHLVTILVALFFAGIVILPVIRIIQRAGFSGWWTLLWFVPFLNVLGLWYFAFGPWPVLRKERGGA